MLHCNKRFILMQNKLTTRNVTCWRSLLSLISGPAAKGTVSDHLRNRGSQGRLGKSQGMDCCCHIIKDSCLCGVRVQIFQETALCAELFSL